MANIVDNLNPDIIVIGGGIADAGELLLNSAKKEMRKNILSPLAKKYAGVYSPNSANMPAPSARLVNYYYEEKNLIPIIIIIVILMVAVAVLAYNQWGKGFLPFKKYRSEWQYKAVGNKNDNLKRRYHNWKIRRAGNNC